MDEHRVTGGIEQTGLPETDIHALHAAFRDAQPFPNVVLEREQMEQVLGVELLHQLASDFPALEPEHARDYYGNTNGKAVHTKTKELGSAYRELDVIVQSQAFLDLISRITGIPFLLYDPEYVGGGTHPNLTGAALSYRIDFDYQPAQSDLGDST